MDDSDYGYTGTVDLEPRTKRYRRKKRELDRQIELENALKHFHTQQTQSDMLETNTVSLEDSLQLNENITADVDPPIAANYLITLRTLISILLSIILTRSPSKEMMNDVLDLLQIILPEDNIVPKSMKELNKYLQIQKLDEHVQKYPYCNICGTLFSSPVINNDICKVCLEHGITTPKCKKKQLQHFFTKFSISNALERFMQNPQNRELLQYRFKRKVNPRVIGDVYDGDQYQKWITDGFLNNPQNVSFTLNTDGVSPYKSSKFTVWPVYLIINELPPWQRWKKCNMILCGLWCDDEKPDMNVFLEPIMSELKQLQTDGLRISLSNGSSIHTKAVLLNCVLDAPAKAAVLNIKSHNAKSNDKKTTGGCPYCKHPGEYDGKKTIFPWKEDNSLRTTDERHAKQTKDKSIKGPTILLHLPHFDVIQNIGIDAMHCLYEGVMSQMLNLWFDSKYSGAPFSFRDHLQDVDKELQHIKLTDAHTRKFRSFETHGKFWKAVELKNFCLMAFAPVMKSFMPQDYYEHFMLFVESVAILASDNIQRDRLTEVESKLQKFVQNFDKLYPEGSMSYNVHMLLHIGLSVRNHGPLWTHSCFPFESFNHSLLRYCHGTRFMNNQISWGLQIQQIYSQTLSSLKLQCKFKKKTWRERKLIQLDNMTFMNQFKMSALEVSNIIQDQGIRLLLAKHLMNNVDTVVTYGRVLLNHTIFHSAKHDAMKQTNNHTVELSTGQFAKILQICILQSGTVSLPIMQVQLLNQKNTICEGLVEVVSSNCVWISPHQVSCKLDFVETTHTSCICRQMIEKTGDIEETQVLGETRIH